MTGIFGRVMMVFFWVIMGLLALGFGPWTLALLLVYLALTGLVLLAIGKQGRSFAEVLGNNDWVFWANGAMGIVSLIAAFLGGPWAFGDMFVLCALGFIPSIAVSFWDEAKEVFAGVFKKHGLGGFIKHVVSWEILEELLKIPFGRR